MAMRIILLVAFVALVSADQEASVGDVNIKVLGRSGKFVLTRGNSSLTFEFDYMKEKDNAGNDVGSTGSEKHSFNSFASKDFTFKPQNNNGQISGVSAITLEFNAVLLENDKGKLKIVMYIFKEDGNVTVGNSTYSVKKGDLKFNVELEDWSYCGDGSVCKKGQTDEVGEFVELGITLKSPENAKKSDDQEDSNVAVFSLGDNEALYVTNEIEVDGVMKTMTSGYPTVDTTGAKQTLKIQLLKGTKVIYDPVASMGGEGTDGGDGGDGGDDGNGGTSGASALMASFFTMAMAFCVFIS